jgi:hypothetical protein
MLNVEGPDVEVLDPILAIQAVQGGTLAQGDGIKAISIKTARFWPPGEQ